MGNLHMELSKVAELRAMLGDSDPELLHDALEGQTDIFEIMDWLLAKLGDEEAMMAAIDKRIDDMQMRGSACNARKDRLRTALEVCMHACGEKSLRRPEATLSLSAVKPSIAQIDDAVLPEAFWRTKREVNKSAINEAIAGGEVVPGVLMTNGGQRLTIRRK